MGFTNGPLLGRHGGDRSSWLFAVLVAINQLGIAADLINILFIGFVAALSLAFGLAFGLGGRDVAAQVTQDFYEGMSSATEKVIEAASAPTRRRHLHTGHGRLPDAVDPGAI